MRIHLSLLLLLLSSFSITFAFLHSTFFSFYFTSSLFYIIFQFYFVLFSILFILFFVMISSLLSAQLSSPVICHFLSATFYAFLSYSFSLPLSHSIELLSPPLPYLPLSASYFLFYIRVLFNSKFCFQLYCLLFSILFFIFSVLLLCLSHPAQLPSSVISHFIYFLSILFFTKLPIPSYSTVYLFSLHNLPLPIQLTSLSLSYFSLFHPPFFFC